MRAARDLTDEELRAELRRTQQRVDEIALTGDFDDLDDLALRTAELDAELKHRQEYRLAQAI